MHQFRKWILGEQTYKEELLLRKEANRDLFLQDAMEGIDSFANQDHQAAIDRIKAKLARSQNRKVRGMYRWSAAAAIFLLLSSALYFINIPKNSETMVEQLDEVEEQFSETTTPATGEDMEEEMELMTEEELKIAPKKKSRRDEPIKREEKPLPEKEEWLADESVMPVEEEVEIVDNLPLPKMTQPRPTKVESDTLEDFLIAAEQEKESTPNPIASISAKQPADPNVARARSLNAADNSNVSSVDTFRFNDWVYEINMPDSKKEERKKEKGQTNLANPLIRPFIDPNVRPVSGFQQLTTHLDSSISSLKAYEISNQLIGIQFNVNQEGQFSKFRLISTDYQKDKVLQDRIFQLIQSGPPWQIINDTSKVKRTSFWLKFNK